MTAQEQTNSSANAQSDGVDEIVHPIAETRAHWSLFLPSLIVALTYAIAWGLLVATGRGDGALAKIMFLVLMIAPPLLLVQAFLRYKSVGLALTEHHVLIAKGWPRLVGEQVKLKNIKEVEVRRSPVGRWLGVGKVVIHMKDARAISVADLNEPEDICDAIDRQIPKS